MSTCAQTAFKMSEHSKQMTLLLLLVIFTVVMLVPQINHVTVIELHKQIEVNNQLASTNTSIVKSEELHENYHLKYLYGFDDWIRGIGNESFRNDIPDSNCIFQSLPINKYHLEKYKVLNEDYMFSQIQKYKHNIFSQISSRIITIKCSKNPFHYQSNSIFSDVNTLVHPPGEKLTKIVNSTDTDTWILKLNPLTQRTWIKCDGLYNFHHSLLPLNILNNSLYFKKKKQIKTNFGHKIPPNVILFVIDSTSRAQFIRSSPRSVEYLTNLMLDRNGKSPSNVFQFFRYSSVGFSTSVNMPAIVGGTCAYCNDSVKFKNCNGLHSYYDSFGYYVPGLNEYFNAMNKDNYKIIQHEWEDRGLMFKEIDFRNKYAISDDIDFDDKSIDFNKLFINDTDIDKKEKMDWISEYQNYTRLDSNNCGFYLSSNVFPLHYKSNGDANRFDTDFAAEFAINMINDLQIKRDLNKIPYFMVLHTLSNHGKNNAFNLDRYISDLLENIDKTNTILHIIGDHGNYQVNNIFDKWETKNPVSIMVIPKYLNTGYLYKNQQQFVNHFDTHLFYKELLYELSGNEDTQYDFMNNLPTSNDGIILSQSLINTEISSNRSCDGLQSSWCFCDILQNKEVNQISEEIQMKYISIIINKINEMTGNGEYLCTKLNELDFKITIFMESNDKSEKEITIEMKQKSINVSNVTYLEMRKNSTLLSFTAEMAYDTIPFVEKKNSLKYPKIMRTSFFKYEKCLTTKYKQADYLDYHKYFFEDVGAIGAQEPIFKDKSMMIKLLKSQPYWNLRLCSCI